MQDEEGPDVKALIATLRSIAAHPTHFSYGAISVVATTAANILDGGPAEDPDEDGPMQCEGQLTIHDFPEQV